MTRIRAASIHLAISSILALIVSAILLVGWYPWPYFKALDGVGLVTLIVGVDVVLGPLLTLIVFKAGKPSLKFDLSVIALIQITALVYGLWAGYVSRVSYAVFVHDRFYLVQANELDENSARKALDAFKTPPLWGPELVGSKRPEQKDEQFRLLMLATTGSGAQNLPEYYRPFVDVLPTVRYRSFSREAIRQKQPALLTEIEQAEQQAGHGLLVLPLVIRNTTFFTLLLNPESGAIEKVIATDPYGD